MAVSGAADVERDLVLSHAAYVGFVFAGPQLAASLLEVGWRCSRTCGERRHLIDRGPGGPRLALLFAAWTRSAWGLSVGLTFAGATSGVACGAAQALLVARDPKGPNRAMVRWTLYASVGDLPGANRHRGVNRARFLVPRRDGAIAHRRRDAVRRLGARPARPRLRGGAGRRRRPPSRRPIGCAPRWDGAARGPRLWLWLFVAALCTLLDGIVVALAVLRLNREQGVPSPWRPSRRSSSPAAPSSGRRSPTARWRGSVDDACSSGAPCLCAVALGRFAPAHTPIGDMRRALRRRRGLCAASRARVRAGVRRDAGQPGDGAGDRPALRRRRHRGAVRARTSSRIALACAPPWPLGAAAARDRPRSRIRRRRQSAAAPRRTISASRLEPQERSVTLERTRRPARAFGRRRAWRRSPRAKCTPPHSEAALPASTRTRPSTTIDGFRSPPPQFIRRACSVSSAAARSA